MSATQLMSRLSLKAITSAPIEAPSDSTCVLTSQDMTYSPPPSPTRITSVARFDSPALYYSPRDTPSLLDETFPSSLSSPSFAHTPMAYATTRNVRQHSSFVGLGFTGLLQHDGSLFDGMGALATRADDADFIFFIDDAHVYRAQGAHTAHEYQEDAWRKRMSASVAPPPPPPPHAPFSALWSPTAAPLGCSSPAARPTHSKTKAKSKPASPMPAAPDADDVFFTRSPTLGSPFAGGSPAAPFDFLHVAH